MEHQAPNRRNLVVLTFAQALGASSAPIIIAFGGLVGRRLTDNPHLVTLPVSVYQLGVAAAVLPISWAMAHWGRRNAYLLGGFFGLLAGLCATMGIVTGSFWLFCLGTIIAGCYNATIQSYRFAVTDYAAPQDHSKFISLIMIGALVGAVFGPRLGVWMKDIYSEEYAGSFLAQIFLALLALPVLVFLYAPKSDVKEKKITKKLPIKEILRLKNYLMGVSAGAVSYGLMSFLMTASPMAMEDHHHSSDAATWGIQAHIFAMFAPSFVTGYLVKYFGAEKVTAAGLVLIMLSAAFALTGYEFMQFFSALVLLGVGWNFGFIGSTAMIAAHCTPENRVQVQGLNDFIIFGVVALCSFASGALLHLAGWELVNIMVFPIVLAVLIPLLWQMRRAEVVLP